MHENLEKAIHDLGFALDGLQAELHKSGAVDAIILFRVISQVRAAQVEVENFRFAKIIDKAGAK